MTNIEVLKSRSLSSLQALHFWVSDSSPVVHAWATSRNHAWPTRSPCSIAGAMVSNGYMTPFMPTGRKVAIYCMYIIVVLLNPTSVWSVSLTNFRLSSHLDAPMKNRLSSRQIHQRNLPSNVKRTKRCLKHGFMTMFWSCAQAIDTGRNDSLKRKPEYLTRIHVEPRIS